jgi:hypothetical protein
MDRRLVLSKQHWDLFPDLSLHFAVSGLVVESNPCQPRFPKSYLAYRLAYNGGTEKSKT